MTDTSQLPDGVLDAAAAVVRRLTGLVFSPVRRGALAEGVTRAMRRARVRDGSAYIERLATDRSLLEDLASEITVGESYFFRAPEQIAVIVELLREASAPPRPGPLRVWSAGCAGGEEPYTIAIALHRAGLAGAVHLLATDLSPRALERARRGRYGRWALRAVDPDIEHAYFRPVRDEFELVPEIRQAVELRALNLAEDNYPSLTSGVWGLDLIVCRNVLIYFDSDTAVRVLGRLLDSLSPDGWLVLGASDPTIVAQASCEGVMTSAGLVYRRRGRAVSIPLAAAPVEAPTTRAPRPPEPPPAAPARLPPLEPAAAPPAIPMPASAAPAAEVEDLGAKAALLVRALANQGRLADAGRECATALDRHRTSAELHYLHAVLQGEAGRHADAAAAARRALYLDPTLVVAHLALATALARSGAADAARLALRNARRLLDAMPAQHPVPAADGESAGRLREMADVRLTLLTEAAA